MARAMLRSMNTFRLGGVTLLLSLSTGLIAQPAVRQQLLLPVPAEASLMTLLDRFAEIDAAASRETTDGVAAPMGSMEVVVARVSADGKVTYGCVDSAAGIRRALDSAPARAGKARE
jgi:hypothetical protein